MSEEIKAAFELDIAAVWFELDATVCELAAWLDVLWFAFEVEVAARLDDDCAAVEELLLLLVEVAAFEFDALALLVESAC